MTVRNVTVTDNYLIRYSQIKGRGLKGILILQFSFYVYIWSIEKLSTDDPDLKKKECNWQATNNNK